MQGNQGEFPSSLAQTGLQLSKLLAALRSINGQLFQNQITLSNIIDT